MRVVWTKKSREHLGAIFDYISRDSAQYARRMVDRITSRSKQLAVLPQSGRVVPEFGHSDIREIVEGAYRIIYQVDKPQISVLAVIHSARLLPADVDDVP